jgi:DNA-binding transcriptional ArsR family regulator
MYIEDRDLDVEVFDQIHAEVRKHRAIPSVYDRVLFAWLCGVVARGYHPSHRLAAHEMGSSKNTVTSALKRLEDLGMIRVERRGNGRSSRYEITWTAPKEGSR